jgi:hypothetical protein
METGGETEGAGFEAGIPFPLQASHEKSAPPAAALKPSAVTRLINSRREISISFSLLIMC